MYHIPMHLFGQSVLSLWLKIKKIRKIYKVERNQNDSKIQDFVAHCIVIFHNNSDVPERFFAAE